MKLILILFLILIILQIIEKKKEKLEDMPNIKAYKMANKLGIGYINNFNLPIKGTAVMFDIDDTLLYVNGNNLIPIKPMINLLNYCIEKGLLIIIITARDNKYQKETINDLNHFGINYSFLYLRQTPQDNHELFKSNIKEQLIKNHGIHILMSVGDNTIDIIGPYSGYGLKLPNKSNKNLYETSLDGSNLNLIKI